MVIISYKNYDGHDFGPRLIWTVENFVKRGLGWNKHKKYSWLVLPLHEVLHVKVNDCVMIGLKFKSFGEKVSLFSGLGVFKDWKSLKILKTA